MVKRHASTGEVQLCPTCEEELAIVSIAVDGNDLLMKSCDKCDKRSWQLAGNPIDLQSALVKVEQQVSRRG